MKRNHSNRTLLCGLLTMLLLLTCLPLGASAEEGDYVAWSLSEDGRLLTGDETEYVRYELPETVYLDPAEAYGYLGGVILPGDEYLYADERCPVYAPEPGAALVWIEEDVGEFTLYVTKIGRRLVEEQFLENPAQYRLQDDYGASAELLSATADALRGATATETVEISTLKNLDRWVLTAYDPTDTLAMDVGVIYRLENEELAYLAYDSLTNQNFDADGNLSYRSGSVRLASLSASDADAVLEAADKTAYRSAEYTWENGGTDEVPAPLFWISYVLVGLILPVPFLVTGLLMARSKKPGHPRDWYVLSGIAAAWIFLALVLMGILL